MPTLATTRLELRPYESRDREGFIALVSDPGVMARLGGPAADPSGLFEWLCSHDPALGELGWGVFPRGTTDLAGHVFLQSLSSKSAELGFLVLPSFQGQGLATEAARAVLQYGFSELGLSEVHATVDLELTGDQRVLHGFGILVRCAAASGGQFPRQLSR